MLERKGVETNLVMVDVRRDAIEDAVRFARENGIINANARIMDALESHKLGRHDIVLVYGGALVHFNDWNLVRLIASATAALEEDGIIIIEELDRVNAIFRTGYKEVIVENKDPENLSLSVHVNYDPITGSYYRLFTKLKTQESVVLPLSFRSVAHVASLLWIFVEEVDLVPASENSLYFILGRKPERAVSMQCLRKSPKALERRTKKLL